MVQRSQPPDDALFGLLDGQSIDVDRAEVFDADAAFRADFGAVGLLGVAVNVDDKFVVRPNDVVTGGGNAQVRLEGQAGVTKQRSSEHRRDWLGSGRGRGGGLLPEPVGFDGGGNDLFGIPARNGSHPLPHLTNVNR